MTQTYKPLVDVEITWDEGDPSVGIWAGFGEDTGAYINKGPFSICVIWDTKEMRSDGNPAKDWPIEEIQTNYIVREGDKVIRWHGMGLEENPMKPVYHKEHKYKIGDTPMVLGDFPEIAEAVQKAWDEWRRIEQEEIAKENAYYEQLAKEADEFGAY